MITLSRWHVNVMMITWQRSLDTMISRLFITWDGLSAWIACGRRGSWSSSLLYVCVCGGPARLTAQTSCCSRPTDTGTAAHLQSAYYVRKGQKKILITIHATQYTHSIIDVPSSNDHVYSTFISINSMHNQQLYKISCYLYVSMRELITNIKFATSMD
jgi:hypothetical protein